VGPAIEGVVAWTLAQAGNDGVGSVNALVGETNDGRLNDIRARPVTPTHVREAIERAAGGPVEEGSVGAGTGTVAFGWKGGIGTASRVLPPRFGGYTLGVLVQTNFGGILTMGGTPVGLALGHNPFANRDEGLRLAGPSAADGSCMIVVATDAPLDARDLKRLAARAVFALARTGSSYSNGSGDYAIAFSTAREARVPHGAREVQPRAVLPADAMSPLFQAVLEATEEAVDNSLLRATTVTGNGRTVEAIPIDSLRAALERRSR
jgi:D-aminopeptidase